MSRHHSRCRSRLHLSKVEKFAEWAVCAGYVREKTRGVFEVLRLRRGGDPPLIFYQHIRGDHATTTHGATGLVDRWLRERFMADQT